MNGTPLAAPGASPVDPYTRYLRSFFSRWSPLYDAFAAPIGFAYRAAVVTAGAAAGRSLLDLCTGTGELALRAARRGAEVTAVDFTPSMLRRARRKGCGRVAGAIRWLEMDCRSLAFADRSFDVSVLSFALHDMPRTVRRQVLLEAARVARDGVVVLDYDPAVESGPGRAVLRLLATFETAYLRGFVRSGGAEVALRTAGLDVRARSRPVPGLFGVWKAVPRSGS
ncbi:MAG: class I SAM-dependent methyltransferase [Thermoanaerobaculia bacterium]